MFIKILSPRRTGFDPGPVCFPCIFPLMLHTYHLNITYIRRTSGRDLAAFSGYRGTFVRKVFSHCFSSLQRVRVHMFWCCFSVYFFELDSYVSEERIWQEMRCSDWNSLSSYLYESSTVTAVFVFVFCPFCPFAHCKLNAGFVAQTYHLSLRKQTNFKGTPLFFVAVESNRVAL